MTTLTFTALEAPADVPAVREVLAAHGLAAPEHGPLLVDERSGAPSSFEASFLGPGATTFYGTLFHASPDDAELAYGLAAAGGLLITAAPGPPHIIVCGGTHDAVDVTDESVPPWLEIICFVDSPAELREALGGGWRRHRSPFADRYWGGPEKWPEEHR
ncbi:MAG: hypothetical protein Q4F37_03985 [Corynebacterium sp.]|uniref:hypothetical protein n=1 Tax=Corynebacterium sp. TaxID=1720 RepID=UPI00270E1D57|nr:hypothetical protein [Corynebacterium sp.]